MSFAYGRVLISLGMRILIGFLLVFHFFLVHHSAVFAQKRDSLEQVLASPSLSADQELRTLEAMYSEISGTDSTSGVVLRRILDLTLQRQDYTKFGRWAAAFFHSEAPGTLDTQEKISILKKAASFEEQIETSRIKGNVYLKLGGAYFGLLNYDSAIYFYEESVRRFGSEDSIYIADAKFFTGQAHDYQGNLLQAMRAYQEARDLYEALGDEEYVHFVLGGMAILFSRYGIYDEADSIRSKIIAYHLASDKTSEAAIQLYNRAEDLRKQNRLEEQLHTLRQIEQMMPLQPDNPYFNSVFHLSLANYFGRKGDLSQQLGYFQKAQEYIQNVPSLQGKNPTTLFTKVLIAKNQNNRVEANQLAKEYLDLVSSSGDMDHLIRAREILAVTYADLGQQKEAADTWKSLIQFKDSLNSANRSATFAYYQTLYETEKKEREILNKTQELEEAKQKTAAQTRIFLTVIAGLLIVGGGGFLGKSLQQAKKEKKLQERFSHELLKNQEEERKRISKDLHDGLGQSLLLIKNRVALNKDENTGQLLDTAISELRAIARSLHPMQLEKLGLSKATEQLLDQIDRETDLFVSTEIDEVKGKLSKEQELQLYRILQECLNNVLKHAQASAIRVSLSQSDRVVSLKIEDNGKGFDFSERYNDFQSLGLKTLKERTAAIEGVMKVNSEKGKGSQFTFTIHV